MAHQHRWHRLLPLGNDAADINTDSSCSPWHTLVSRLQRSSWSLVGMNSHLFCVWLEVNPKLIDFYVSVCLSDITLFTILQYIHWSMLLFTIFTFLFGEKAIPSTASDLYASFGCSSTSYALDWRVVFWCHEMASRWHFLLRKQPLVRSGTATRTTGSLSPLSTRIMVSGLSLSSVCMAVCMHSQVSREYDVWSML